MFKTEDQLIWEAYTVKHEDKVDPHQLAMGIEVETEHTDDSDAAEKIARDHLAEDPEYYTKLKKAKL